jgi:hypothetical protein
MSLLTAKPKVGKTTFALNRALAVARGEPFMDRSTNKGRVLYLALEEKRSEVQRRFASLGATNEDIFIHTAPAPEAAMDAPAAAVNELRPALVIIDPLLKLIRLKDANDYALVNAALEPVLTLARVSGAHIMALHHQGKFVRDDSDDILGSTAFFGAVDTSLEMRKKGLGRTICSTQRYGTDIEEVVITMDQETGSVSPGGSLEGLEIAKAREQILKATQGQALTRESIREAVKVKTTIIMKAFARLKEEGAFTTEGTGKKGDPFRYQVSEEFAKKITDPSAECDSEPSKVPVPGSHHIKEPEKPPKTETLDALEL